MFLGSKARRILGVELDPSLRGIVKDFNKRLPMAVISANHFCSESTIRRRVREAHGLGLEVDLRPTGGQMIDREEVLEKFEMGKEFGFSKTDAVRFAARMGDWSESTVWRALNGK